MRLPPDRDSHNFKVTRRNYHTYMLLHYDQVEPAPSPLGHGWALENGKLLPIRHSKMALPKTIKEAMKNLCISSGDFDCTNSDTNDEDNSIEDAM